jgi:16S rRNA (uracil1498-N3)-methyltransferase
MPRFFVRSTQIENGIVTINGDDAFHISRSLRMAAGEHITVCDMQRKEYDCLLEHFGDGQVLARILSESCCDTEPPFYARLFQALPKGDKLDTVIQKSVECGVSEITLFESERCVVRADRSNEAKKSERRSRIAFEAAKQCGRGIIPSINLTLSFKEAVAQAKKADIPLFCYEGNNTLLLGKVLRKYISETNSEHIPNISIMIGSEGGFSRSEAEYAIEAGMVPIGLGKRILRTETAAMFVLSSLVYEFELN